MRGFWYAWKFHSRICVKFKWNIVNIYQRQKVCVKKKRKIKSNEFQKSVVRKKILFFSSISFLIFAPTVYYIKTDRRRYFSIRRLISFSYNSCEEEKKKYQYNNFFFSLDRFDASKIVGLEHLIIKCQPSHSLCLDIRKF